jgi:energy-coupling factor transporter ATP-binding protein EcfA2
MLTKLTIRRFKKFNDVEIDLGNPVVFIGPNDSGKTTALQALAIWDIGLKKWKERYPGPEIPKTRTGVTINRRDLVSVPIPNTRLLWRDLHVRVGTNNLRMEIIVEGVSNGKAWSCGLEFDYANPETFYCRPLKFSDDSNSKPIPDEVSDIRIAFLPPMSGLSDREFVKQQGEINFLIGQGRTAEMLRNLCYQLLINYPDAWKLLREKVKNLFGIMLDDPEYIQERSEITMTYKDRFGTELDLSSSGRGLQQTLLILAYLAWNKGSVLLLDEPDAHLEMLRQQQIYQLLSEWAQEQNSQIIAASHSEAILNEAANRDVVVAFIGKPHRIDDRGSSQLMKSLKDIGFEQYVKAEQTGWVLYLEGSTDLAILRAFAHRLNHRANNILERPFVNYIGNQPNDARKNFYGLREAYPSLIGLTICDRDAQLLSSASELSEYKWQRREIENYLCQPDTLLNYAEASGQERSDEPLFDQPEINRRREIMQDCINDFVPRAALRDLSDQWWINTKVSDDFLNRLFDAFFSKLELTNLMRKTNYHVLVQYIPEDQIDPEIINALDKICEVAEKAKPVSE